MGFNDFIRERRYLNNVSASTISWYTHALKWLPNESPSQNELKDAVLRMREKGLKATGCNAAIRAINAYLHWNSTGGERKCGAGCQHLHIPQLKRAGEHSANLDGISSHSAFELETQAETFLSASFAPAHALVAGHRMPHHGGPYVAHP